MMVVWSLLWIGLMSVVVWVLGQRARGAKPSSNAPSKTAREALDQRLARGDIDLDEYQRRRDALEPREPVAPSGAA
jgi:putative membrane protein